MFPDAVSGTADVLRRFEGAIERTPGIAASPALGHSEDFRNSGVRLARARDIVSESYLTRSPHTPGRIGSVMSCPVASIVAPARLVHRSKPAQRRPPVGPVRVRAGGDESGGPGGFFRKLFTGELGVSAPAGFPGASFTGQESKECSMLRQKVLQGTVLANRKLILAFDADKDGWNAGAFHAKLDNQGPAILIAKTKKGGYFGAFNPLGWASREDYRDAFNAFLVKWPKKNSTEGEPFILEKVGGSGAAIFDFGAEGPIFGADALKIPLGRAPSMGSSYAAIGGSSLFGGGKEIKSAKSRLGSAYASPPDDTYSLFGPGEKFEAKLVELRVYTGEGLDGFYA